MPRISGDVNISAELRIAQPNGRSTPIREWDAELSTEDDTYICTTWIDLDSLDADPVEYLVEWQDLGVVPRAHRGRLVVDGEPVANRFINPHRRQRAAVIDLNRYDDQYCTKLEFAKLKTTNQPGSDVRILGDMAGIIKLEIEIGWFQYEDVRKITFKRIEPTHPLLDARPVNAAGLASSNPNGGLTHTSKFGRIFTKPFRLPGSEPNGVPLQTKFLASPPPFRGRPGGRHGKRPFAVFYWVIGKPAHLEEPDQNPAPTSPLANGLGWDRSMAPSPASVTGRNEWEAYHRDQADGAASGSGTTGHHDSVKAEGDVKPTLASKTPPSWSNTHLTSIDLTLDTDDDSSDDDEVDDLIMDSGLHHPIPTPILALPTLPAAVQSRSTSTTRSTSRDDDRTASPPVRSQPRARTIASAPPPSSSSQGSPRLQRKTSAPPSGSKRASSVEEEEEEEEEEPLFRASSLEIKDEDGEGEGEGGADEEKEEGCRVGGGKRRKVSRTVSGGESNEDDE